MSSASPRARVASEITTPGAPWHHCTRMIPSPTLASSPPGPTRGDQLARPCSRNASVVTVALARSRRTEVSAPRRRATSSSTRRSDEPVRRPDELRLLTRSRCVQPAALRATGSHHPQVCGGLLQHPPPVLAGSLQHRQRRASCPTSQTNSFVSLPMFAATHASRRSAPA